MLLILLCAGTAYAAGLITANRPRFARAALVGGSAVGAESRRPIVLLINLAGESVHQTRAYPEGLLDLGVQLDLVLMKRIGECEACAAWNEDEVAP